MSAPKKYTDATRTEITEEWRAWYDAARDERHEMAEDWLAQHGRDPQDHYPEFYDKDLGEVGDGILVVEEPVTELRSRFRVPTPSLWWARPEVSRPGGLTHGEGRYKASIPGIYRAVIETPGGSLWLYPHEYVVCQHPVPLITDPECTVHPLGGRPPLDEEKQEQLFYIQRLGIPYSDALLMIMDGLDMREWGWVEFPEYTRAIFEGVGATPRLTRA